MDVIFYLGPSLKSKRRKNNSIGWINQPGWSSLECDTSNASDANFRMASSQTSLRSKKCLEESLSFNIAFRLIMPIISVYYLVSLRTQGWILCVSTMYGRNKPPTRKERTGNGRDCIGRTLVEPFIRQYHDVIRLGSQLLTLMMHSNFGMSVILTVYHKYELTVPKAIVLD